MKELLPGLLFQLVCLINTQCTVTVYRSSGTMTSGDCRPKANQSGISFRNQLQLLWNVPESIVTLNVPGVVILDTSTVLDVIRHGCYLGEPRTVFRSLYRTTKRPHGGSMMSPSWIWLVRWAFCLQGGVERITAAVARPLVARMSKGQTDLELMRHDCKARFWSHPTGCCPYSGRNIKHDMASHVPSFHLDLGQLWRCPVSWCTQWKGTPQDCVDHVRQKHNVGDSVKTASLGKWFPMWTITRAV